MLTDWPVLLGAVFVNLDGFSWLVFLGVFFFFFSFPRIYFERWYNGTVTCSFVEGVQQLNYRKVVNQDLCGFSSPRK